MRNTLTKNSIAGALGALLLASPVAHAHDGVEFPPGFQEMEIADWNQPLDLDFLPDGRLLVIEKEGLVWMVDGNLKAATPLLDISDEVANISSRGLKSIAINPSFGANGYIYLLYEVDRHHVEFFDTPQYDPLASDLAGPTIGRLTRFTLDSGDNFESILAGSRKILLGRDFNTGFPILEAHETGSLRFGEDGSLLVSCGDGSAGLTDFGNTATSIQAISDGIITPAQDVGAFRSQLVDTLNGKILRLDPATGKGLPGNPFFQPLKPRAARSRVWAYGFRNPFRFTVMPGTSTGPQHPGRILIGDVGSGLWEELNISETGGENFGWPLYEGMQKRDSFYDLNAENLLAPNPLFGQTIPGVGLCTQEYFTFNNLLEQETTNALSLRNPCAQSQSIPASLLPTMHTRPHIDWGHLGPSRAKSFDGFGMASFENLGAAGSPIIGSQFLGSCAIGGAWYSNGNYPAQYSDSLFIADYTDDWIKLVKFDASGAPSEIIDFGSGIKKLVAFAVNPVDGDVYFIQFSDELHQLTFQAGNLAPTARAAGSPRYGPSPLRSTFTPAGSSDPEGIALSYSWDFGDGTPPSQLQYPVHSFPSADITQSGAVIADVLQLVPAQTNVALGLDPIVIGDGFFANPSTGTMRENYLTFFNDPANSDPNDWVGYEYPQTHKFHKIVFQEGREFAPLGGWFDTLTVEARVGGVWTEATNVQIYPPYTPNDGEYWETYELIFDSIEGDAIRLFGLGGGTEHFVSVGELRVISDPVGTAPKRYDITLTVTDSVNQSSQDTTSVWINNTPPTVTIDSPVNGSTYDPLASENITLSSTSSDLESTTGELSCEWAASLHHNNHTHPEPLINACDSSIILAPHGSINSTFYWEVTLTVTDSHGLTGTATSLLYETAPTLIAQDHSLSLSEGGTATYLLDAGPSKANQTYRVLMNLSGIWPGIDWGGGVILPLNYDQLMLFSLQNPKVSLFNKFSSQFDSAGQATAKFNLPAGSDPSLAGTTLNLAYIGSAVVGQVQFASNAVQLTFTP